MITLSLITHMFHVIMRQRGRRQAGLPHALLLLHVCSYINSVLLFSNTALTNTEEMPTNTAVVPTNDCTGSTKAPVFSNGGAKLVPGVKFVRDE